MAEEHVVDADVVDERGAERANGNGHDVTEERPQPGQALAAPPPAPPRLAVTPQVEAADLVKRLEVIQTAMDDAMKDGVDYGNVPGTDKPTLLKPGAEKLGVLFQLDLQFINDKRWGPGDHLTVTSHATAFHAPTGARMGYGEGLCTTREKKYATRIANLVCPECEAETVFKSKHEPGFYCWSKKGGCGAKFGPEDKRITDQKRGEIDNPNLPDTWNTVIKMAQKRARVDAVLAVTGASALFTQDVEDAGGPPVDDEVTGGSVPRYGVVTDSESMERIARAAAYLLDVGDGPNEDAAGVLLQRLAQRFGEAYAELQPTAAAVAVYETALLYREQLEERGDDPDLKPEPAPEADADGPDADIPF